PLVGQRQADAAAVAVALRARDESVALEPGDPLRHRGSGDPFLRGELANLDAGRVLDRDEQPDLMWGDAADLLASDLAGEVQQRGAEPVGHRHRILLLRRMRHSLTRLAECLTRLTASLQTAIRACGVAVPDDTTSSRKEST